MTTRLYSVFSRLWEETTDYVMLKDEPLTEAKQAIKDREKFFRGHGFSVIRHKHDGDGLPQITVRNPVNGRDEAHFWIRETA